MAVLIRQLIAHAHRVEDIKIKYSRHGTARDVATGDGWISINPTLPKCGGWAKVRWAQRRAVLQRSGGWADRGGGAAPDSCFVS